MLVFILSTRKKIYVCMHALVRFAEKYIYIYIYFDKIDSCVEASLLP
jgi:hypothetical protein